MKTVGFRLLYLWFHSILSHCPLWNINKLDLIMGWVPVPGADNITQKCLNCSVGYYTAFSGVNINEFDLLFPSFSAKCCQQWCELQSTNDLKFSWAGADHAVQLIDSFENWFLWEDMQFPVSELFLFQTVHDTCVPGSIRTIQCVKSERIFWLFRLWVQEPQHARPAAVDHTTASMVLSACAWRWRRMTWTNFHANLPFPPWTLDPC